MKRYRCTDCFLVIGEAERNTTTLCPTCGGFLYQIDADYLKSEREFIVISCFSCDKKLRISFPFKSPIFRCPSCNIFYEIKTINSNIGRKIFLLNNCANKNSNENKQNERELPENVKSSLRILDIDYNSSWEDIKFQYRKCMSEYHPDKVAHLGVDLRRLAEEKTKIYNDAYNILRKYFE
ncbi:J domain-containing protein [Candidatus Electronema sp. JC]|uniref:J domain-containing protein n=1 Tax=Candidatus Electronema sp. JC TaxID=3401570 RepID=UPI003B4285A7